MSRVAGEIIRPGRPKLRLSPRIAETSISWQVGNVKKTVSSPTLRHWAFGKGSGCLVGLEISVSMGGNLRFRALGIELEGSPSPVVDNQSSVIRASAGRAAIVVCLIDPTI